MPRFLKNDGNVRADLKVYFLDSDILDKLRLGWTMIGYLVQFGLAPYYRVEIFSFLLPETGFPPRF